MSVTALRHTARVGALTLLSRLLGFVRDVVIARAFGAGAATDAFFVVFKIPNFFRRLFAEGAFSQAFVPVLADYRQGEVAGEPRAHAEVREFVSHVGSTLFAVLLALTAIGVVAAPILIWVFAPGFDTVGGQRALAEQMLRITWPYLLLISLTAMAGSILNTYQRFAIPALTPVLLNLCLIAAAVWFAPWFDPPVLALAWGVFIAGIAQLALQLPALLRLDLLPRWRRPFAHQGVNRVLRLMGPAVFAASVTQINLLMDTILASLLVAGSVSWLYYADRLVELPVGVFGVALATVLLPRLSAARAAGDLVSYRRDLGWGLVLTVWLMAPAAVGLALLARPLMEALFQYGAFDAHAAAMSALALMAYAVALPAFVLAKQLSSALFALQDTRTPARIAVRVVLVNLVANAVLTLPLWQLGVAWAHVGLVSATALASWLNVWWLGQALARQSMLPPWQHWRRPLAQLAPALLGMALVLWLLPMPELAPLPAWQRLAWLLAAIAAAVFTYALLLALAGVRPRDLLHPPRGDRA